MKRFSLYILFSLSLVLLLNSCKGLQKTRYEATRNISRRKLNKELNKHRFSSRTFESRIGIKYRDDEQNFKASGRIKILKDSIIWGSINVLRIPMLKFMVTPHKVSYYNKIDNTFYDGDFSLLKENYGIDLSFNHLQNILLGDPVEELPVNTYQLQKKPSYYLLESNDFQTINHIKITPFFKVLSEVIGMSPQEYVQLSYAGYQQVKNENIPKKIIIDIYQSGDKKHLELEYKSPSTDKKLRFPFKIPSSYHPIELSAFQD